MKCFTAWAFIIAPTGCTTPPPIDGSHEELRQFINSGELLKAEDCVRLVTADEKTHHFTITKVQAGLIVGPQESIPVDEVISLEGENAKSPVASPFNLKRAVPWAIAIAAFALKPLPSTRHYEVARFPVCALSLQWTRPMKCFTTWILMIALTGCTTLRPIDANHPDLSRSIASGELKIRDHVIIESTDWQTYEFDITSITAASISGKQRSIPIDQIVSIQKRVLNKRRTILLVLSIAGGAALTIALVSALRAGAAAAVLGNSN